MRKWVSLQITLKARWSSFENISVYIFHKGGIPPPPPDSTRHMQQIIINISKTTHIAPFLLLRNKRSGPGQVMCHMAVCLIAVCHIEVCHTVAESTHMPTIYEAWTESKVQTEELRLKSYKFQRDHNEVAIRAGTKAVKKCRFFKHSRNSSISAIS